jgi:hypothetical protein
MRLVKFVLLLALLVLLSHAVLQVEGRTAAANPTSGNTLIYLPLLNQPGSPLPTGPTINAPYFTNLMNGDGSINRFGEMSIAWFGAITPSENYIDVRTAYDADELVIYTAIVDRQIWYDTTPSPADLKQWDSLVVYLDRSSSGTSQPTNTAYRFEVQYSGGSSTSYQAAYQGNGTTWQAANLPFSTFTADRWEAGPPNSGLNAKGWVATIRIPFATLGISQPAQGTVWKLAITNHDRDNAAGTGSLTKSWPSNSLNGNNSTTWGQWHFGLPTYTPPSSTPGSTVTIRHNLNGANVPDANVGGYTVCGGSTDYWTAWGTTPWAAYNSERSDFNVQNQSDIADWPCFARYYITFPLDGVPANKVIRSATLTLHQIGNSNPSLAEPTLLQVLTVADEWHQATATWNNSPQAVMNVARGWIDPLPGHPGFPGVARTVDISLAAAQAYAAVEPLRLVLYAADSEYHSGKYFVASGTGEWNAVGRPTVTVSWGNP